MAGRHLSHLFIIVFFGKVAGGGPAHGQPVLGAGARFSGIEHRFGAALQPSAVETAAYVNRYPIILHRKIIGYFIDIA